MAITPEVVICCALPSQSCGSTPAPPVNTPVSARSQPVSLPDNNCFARAISRALVESLPLLLSSLQDSSGGNTKLAATSGPLILASNSMQYLASLSSGTPCSTSQSLGVRLLFPCFFQLTAHLAVLWLSLLFLPRLLQTCL